MGLDGTLQPFKIRYYQVQAIFHLLTMKRFVLGDDTGTGKTPILIASLCYAWEKEINNNAIVVTTKSALRQWVSEIQRFSNGIKTFVVSGQPLERRNTYEAFKAYQGPDKKVLVLGYSSLVRDWNSGATRPLLPNGNPDPKAPLNPGLLDGITKSVPNLTVTFDECHSFKNNTTKTWQVCHDLSMRAHRCYGLTATLLQNRLMEGFCIYKCIYPDVFTTKTAFLKDYCVTRMQPVGGGRQIPVVVGYKNLQGFRDRIDPFYLGRAKHLISNELPKLITKDVIVELTAAEDAKYKEALSGILEMGDGEIRDYEEHKAFVSLIFCQQTVDSLALLRYDEGDQIDIDMFHQEQSTVK
jgi:SNF2 family DNA or RNA helicase